MTIIDRRYGVSGGIAIKAPARVATTTSIVLAGEQTIDGIAVVENDRVLAKNQSDTRQNGIYLVSTGNWARAPDFNGARDVARGTRVFVNEGTQGNSEFVVTSTDPVGIGSSDIVFADFEVLLNAAPGGAQYLVAASDGNLSAERVATNTATVAWNFATAGQAKASVPAASETVPGVVELATNAEAIAGTDAARAVTPTGVAAALAAVQVISGAFRNLVIQNNAGAPNARVDIDADAVTVETSGGVAFRLTSINLTIDGSVTGVNGLDASDTTMTNNTWYAVIVLYNPATATAIGMLSTSTSGPITTPPGYTAKARFGWMRTNGSAQFNRVLQKGKRAQYVVVAGSPTTALPIAAAGLAGSTSAPTWVAVPLSNFVPPTAAAIIGNLTTFTSGGGGSIAAIVAPNNSYGVAGSVTNGPPAQASATDTGSAGTSAFCAFQFNLENTNIYWASGNANSRIWVLGWDDNI